LNPSLVAQGLLTTLSQDADLQRLVATWVRLPEHVRRAIVTLAAGCL
jgi:hypothetical protein